MTRIKKHRQNLLPWNRRFEPWSNMMLKDFLSTDDFFNDDFFEEDSLMPAMNVKETTDDLIVEVAAPGFSKNDFEVTLDEDMLHVSAKKSKEDMDEDKDSGYTRKEFSYNAFRRSMKLPDAIDLKDTPKASYNHGILCITIKKTKEAKAVPTKTIEVA